MGGIQVQEESGWKIQKKIVVDISIILKMGLKSLRIGEIFKEESVVKKIETLSRTAHSPLKQALLYYFHITR